MTGPSVAIVGGGTIGVTAASELASRGAEVTVYERAQLGSGSTGRAVGILYDVFASEVEVEMAARSFERFAALDSTGDAFEFTEEPFVWFATEGDDETIANVRERVDTLRKLGQDVEEIDGETLGARYPSLHTDDIAVAGCTTTAGYADPHQYTMTMSQRAQEQGVYFELGTAVSVETDPLGIRVDGTLRETDVVVVAAGTHTKRLLAAADVSVPLEAYRVQAATCTPENVDVETIRSSVPMIRDASDNFYYRPDAEGLAGGGGPGTVRPVDDVDDWDRDADFEFLLGIAADLEHRLPEYELAATSTWAGLCVGTPDQRPILGEIEDGLYVSAGWQGHGFMRSPAAGEYVADAVIDGDRPPAELSPDRFSGEETFEPVTGMSAH